MNAGFSNLDWLKKQLLPDSMKGEKRFDARVLAIGKGVAASFDRYCNREFAYAAGIQEVFSGDRPFWFARRSPVTDFTKVELRYFRSDAWADISGQPLAADEEKGMIHFGYTLGRSPIQVRLTYNGGYLFNTLDPDDQNYQAGVVTIPDEVANNSAGIDPNKFLLPDDLLFAWVTQVRKVWEAIDKVGDKILSVGSNTRNPSEALAGLDLVPEVRETLDFYRRYQLT
jgi:hypothetical protein